MKAEFERNGSNNVVLVLAPENEAEGLILALWMRYDQNSFAAEVDRDGDEEIVAVRLFAGSAA